MDSASKIKDLCKKTTRGRWCVFIIFVVPVLGWQISRTCRLASLQYLEALGQWETSISNNKIDSPEEWMALVCSLAGYTHMYTYTKFTWIFTLFLFFFEECYYFICGFFFVFVFFPGQPRLDRTSLKIPTKQKICFYFIYMSIYMNVFMCSVCFWVPVDVREVQEFLGTGAQVLWEAM